MRFINTYNFIIKNWNIKISQLKCDTLKFYNLKNSNTLKLTIKKKQNQYIKLSQLKLKV